MLLCCVDQLFPKMGVAGSQAYPVEGHMGIT